MGPRKRSSTSSFLLEAESGGGEPPRRKSRNSEISLTSASSPSPSSLATVVLQNEVDTLKSALEHERSVRELDQRRSQQIKQRLERKVEFAVEEAEEAKQLLEETREQSDAHIRDLREKHRQSLEELRDCQGRLMQLEVSHDEERSFVVLEEMCLQLQRQLVARDEENEALQHELTEVRNEALLIQQRKSAKEQAEPFAQIGQSSPADASMLKELNRVRIQLAESERKYRQLRRKADEWKAKSQQLVHQTEAVKSSKQRANKLEKELSQVRKQLEERKALNQSWEGFAKDLGQALQLTTSSSSAPPEVSTVMRHLQRQIKACKTAEAANVSLENQLETTQHQISSLEKEARDTRTALQRLDRDKKDAETKLEIATQQVEAIRSQEGIWRRESDGLRALIKTYDDVAPSKQKGNAQLKEAQLRVKSLQDELKVIKSVRDTLSARVKAVEGDKTKLQSEHDRVLEKFTKLRDALMEERAKASKAEDRAIDAELLAGKGAFNESQTRVLSMEKNPLMDAMRERFQAEIYSLRRRLEQMTGQKVPDGIVQDAVAVDPEKLHQRLKQHFKEQISTFREGVHLITGFKIDMIPKNKGTSFRVRSCYAEREDDYLEFFWPKNVKSPTSLDLVATEFAKTLSATSHSYQYLKKYDSCPAFAASAQLELFEKCTMVAQG